MKTSKLQFYCNWKCLQTFTSAKTCLKKQGHPLVVVVVVLIIVAAVHFGWGVGDDTVRRGVEQTGSLLWYQQGRGVLNTVAFLHIVHLQQAGKNRRNRLSKHKQTTKALTKTRPRYRLILWLTSCERNHYLSPLFFISLHQRQKVQ